MSNAHPATDVVMMDSPDAATYRTDIKGWVSRNGRFYGDDSSAERIARYDGCTHRKCDRCDAITDKHRIICEACGIAADHERWLKLELVEWDGEAPLVIHGDDQYFFSADEVYEYALDHEVKVSELDLVVCKPNYARYVEMDYWCDELPEEGEPPGWLEDAVDKLNAAIKEHANQPLSWSEGKQRVVLPDEEAA